MRTYRRAIVAKEKGDGRWLVAALGAPSVKAAQQGVGVELGQGEVEDKVAKDTVRSRIVGDVHSRWQAMCKRLVSRKARATLS